MINPNIYKQLHKFYQEDLCNFRKDFRLNIDLIRHVILNNMIRFDVDNWICHNPFELEIILRYFHGIEEESINIVNENKQYPVLLEFQTEFKNNSYGALVFIPSITQL